MNRNVLANTQLAWSLMKDYFSGHPDFNQYNYLDNCGEPIWSRSSIATTPVPVTFFANSPVTAGAVTGNWHSDLQLGDCFMLIIGIKIVLSNAVRLVDLDMLEVMTASFFSVEVEGKTKMRNVPIYEMVDGPHLRECTSSVAAIASDVHVAGGPGEGIFETAIPYLPKNKINAGLTFNTTIAAIATACPVDCLLYGPRLYKDSAR